MIVMSVVGMAGVVVIMAVSLRGRMVVMTVRGGRVIVVPMRFVTVIVMGVIRRWMLRSRVVVRRGMRGGGVMPVRIRRGRGMVVVTRVAVVVVRLVLVAHLGSVPQPLFRGHCGEIGIT